MFTSLLAHVHGWGWYGPGPWILLFPLFWITLFALVFWRFRRGPWGPWRYVDSGRSVLDERYARGEITADEYRERRAVMTEDRR
jgi:putative membrane protein